jgi:hypothetical protein
MVNDYGCNMKLLKFGPVLIISALLLACGNGHPRLMSMSVSPSTATVSMQPAMMSTMMGTMAGTMTFTAMGQFSNNTSRMLTRADGLTWASSNNMIATVDMNGMATCVSAGTVQITASVPVSTSMMMGMNMQSNSSAMSATATLTCM